MKILLTGGNGFIGHNLAIHLKNKGHQVNILDSLSVNNLLSFTDSEIVNQKLYRSILNERINLLNSNNINLQVVDARDYHLYSKIYSSIDPEIVIHLAAVSHANKSNKDPHNTFDHSLRTLENTLDVCRVNKTHVIYLSSSMVYGNFTSGIVNEKTPCNPIGIYGTLKYSGELIVKAYNEVFDLPYTIIRPSALYGERCVSRRVGQAFIENAIVGKDLTINGDGEESLDFTYIEDLIQGIILSIINKKAINEIFNITFGSSRKINSLAELVRNRFEGIKVKYNPRDDLMPERGTLSVDKAKSLLGYQPSNPIEKGFTKYIDWYKKFALDYPNLFQKT